MSLSHTLASTAHDLSPFQAFQRQSSMIDFPGQLAAVFFTGGCNFRCRYCHNRDFVALGQMSPSRLPWSRLVSACAAFSRNWVTAAVITGGEPTLHADLPDSLAYFKKRGWRVKLDTNGSNPDMLATCLPLVDYVAMDVKADLPGYPVLTGFDDSEALARSIALIKAQARDYCFRTTVIESFHTDARMQAIGSLIRGARCYVLQPFVPRASVLDPAWAALPRTSVQRMDDLRRLMASYADAVM